MPEALYFTESDEANRLIAQEPLALLIGFALDQQVTVPTAFLGPQKLTERIGALDAKTIAAMDPDELEMVFREKPAIHRFPGSMAWRLPGEYVGSPTRRPFWRSPPATRTRTSWLCSRPGRKDI